MTSRVIAKTMKMLLTVLGVVDHPMIFISAPLFNIISGALRTVKANRCVQSHLESDTSVQMAFEISSKQWLENI